ncbi:MAG: DUF3596 domain-containing protein, partial [Gammaproteobacteria bacterium]|nr:DUF3596 domain-containing protein [Gammaproteobacteria bacterium]
MTALYLQNLPPGIEIRQGKNKESIRLRFYWNGQQHNETLKGKTVCKASVEFAKRKLALINYQIAEGTFNYADHFPDSKKAVRTEGHSDRTVGEGLKSYLARVEQKLAPSSFRNYKGKALKHIVPKWGDRKVRDLVKTEIQDWQLIELPAAGLSDKTINLIFIVLRGIFDDARGDQIIQFDPLSLITNFEQSDAQEPDPFTTEELRSLLAIDTDKQQEINAYGFNARSGLRECELLGLAWEDININTWRATIRRGRVANEYRVPKTRDSTREIELQAEAVEYLKRQMQYTYALPPEEVKVRQRNARSFETEHLRFVFHCTSTGRPWSGDTVFRKTFARLLVKARVRYRGPNHLRHTFASWLITNAVPLEWIAPIMGTSVAILKKHYARIIPGDRPNFGGVIADLLKNQA